MTQTRMKNSEGGFTLIELLIVVAIIAILAAIAIPQLNSYRARSVRATIFADAKNAATTLEGYFIDNRTYAPVDGETATGPAGTLSADLQSFRPSKGNTVTISSTQFAYTVTVSNPASDGDGYTGALNFQSIGICQWASGQFC